MERYSGSGVYDHSRGLNSQITRVFGWMFVGLMATGITALFTVRTSLIYFTSNLVTYLLLLVVELGLVWFLSSRALKMNYASAAMAFMVYSVLNGVTLASIFLVYSGGTIALAFFVAAGFFGFMAVYGLVTKSDLTSIGPLLFAGLIGIIIASIINFFFASSTFDLIISFVAVAVFLGLTAYDAQKIRQIHAAYAGTDKERNVGIIGALTLYLDFINLFLFILRILGRSRD